MQYLFCSRLVDLLRRFREQANSYTSCLNYRRNCANYSCHFTHSKMSEAKYRLFLSKKRRAAVEATKWKHSARDLYEDILNQCLEAIMKVVHEMRTAKRNITMQHLLTTFNAMCLEGDTASVAIDRQIKNADFRMFRNTTIYRKIKEILPKNSVRGSTIQLLTHFMDALGESLFAAAVKNTVKGKRKMISDIDVHVACTEVSNVSILLNGRTRLSAVPPLTSRTAKGYVLCGSATAISA